MNDMVISEGRAVLSASDIRAQVNLVQEVMRAVMKDGTHYGTIPGTPKPTLYKAGAEVLGATFRIAPEYRVDDLSTEDCYRYRVTCLGRHQTSGIVLAAGMGSASSNEQKYKWRKAICKEEFDATSENRKRLKYGHAKGGGHYTETQVRSEPDDIENTVLKMACKRAQIAMTLNATAASDIFTQDIEDLPEGMTTDDAPRAKPKAPRSKSAPSAEPPSDQGAPAGDAPANGDAPASEGQIAFTRKKIEAAGHTWMQALEHFKIGEQAIITGGQCKQFLLWAQRPDSGASA